MELAKIGKYSKKFLKENKVEEETQELAEGEEMGDEPEGDSPPEAPVASGGSEMPPPAPAAPPAPAGNLGEPEIQALVKAFADFITQQSGVPVAVEPEGGMGGEIPPAGDVPPPSMGGEEEVPPVMETGSKRTPEVTPPDRKPDMAREGKKSCEEETLEEATASEPKKTYPNEKNQGKPKKGEHPSVEGADKPKAIEGAPADAKMKTLEEALVKRILAKLVQEVKARQVAPVASKKK